MKSWVVGQFSSTGALIGAIGVLKGRGHRDLDAYSPFPIEGMEEALALPRSKVNWIVLVCALSGTVTGFMLQWFCNAWDYPIIVGGRPMNSWPSFIPITFELSVLFGGVGAFIGVFVLMGLPQVYHPLFEVAEFRRASIDRFWVSIGLDDPATDTARLEGELRELGADPVAVVRAGRR